MILSYIFSALSKPELASGVVELLLRLFLSPQIQKISGNCLRTAGASIGKVGEWLVLIATTGAVLGIQRPIRKRRILKHRRGFGITEPKDAARRRQAGKLLRKP